MKALRSSVFVIVLLLTTFSNGVAQNGSKLADSKIRQPTPTNCESNAAALDAINQLAGKDNLIIAIARLGNRERKRELNQRRLNNVLAYLTRVGWQRAPETVIIAEGVRAKGYGRVELYVGGKLIVVLAVKRNSDLEVLSCAS